MTALKAAGLTDAIIDRAASAAALGNGTDDMRALLKVARNADLWLMEIALGQAALAAGGLVPIYIPPNATQRIKIRELVLSGAGTAFSGGGGDRLVSVTDGTSTWTAITAALLGTPIATRWGGTGIPYPATAAHHLAQSVAGQNVRALYTGGTADYTAGALTLLVEYEIFTA